MNAFRLIHNFIHFELDNKYPTNFNNYNNYNNNNTTRNKIYEYSVSIIILPGTRYMNNTVSIIILPGTRYMNIQYP